jgi:hypothetical protein
VSIGSIGCALALTACGIARQLGPIQLVRMGAIGATEGAGAMASAPQVSAPLPGGARVLIPAGATPPLVYAANGQFLGNLDAGTDSSDTFDQPVFVRLGPGDSIWVFDAGERVLVFDPDRKFVRAVPLPVAPWDAVVLPDGRILVTTADAGHPLPALLLDDSGRVVRQIGAADTAAMAIQAPRHIFLGPDGSWWTMPTAFRWQLEHWDTLGQSLGTLKEPHPRWFAPYDKLQAGSVSQPPSPTLSDAWFDNHGHLWVMGEVADSQWSKGFGPPPPNDSDDQRAVIIDPDRAFDTMLEAIDPTTDSILAQTRLDASYVSAVEPGVLLRVIDTKAGWKRAVLMQVRFDDRKRS